jgi:hypothetical protein
MTVVLDFDSRSVANMGESTNTLNTAKLKMGRPNKLTVLCTLIIVVILVCVSLDVSYQELGRPTFLESVFGLAHIILKDLSQQIF